MYLLTFYFLYRWMFLSLISTGSSIFTVMIISHYMGLRDMLCYSGVWFVIYLAFVVNDAWYNAIYKHVNVSAALETKEGYAVAGKYIQIGVVGNFLISLPLSVLSVIYMPTIIRWLGYDEAVAEISQGYAAITLANNLIDTTAAIIDCVLDIDGHGKYTAVFELWDTIFSGVLVFGFVREYHPNLLELGVFHFVLDIVATMIYFLITWKRKKWFDSYSEGLFAPIWSMVSYWHRYVLSSQYCISSFLIPLPSCQTFYRT